MTKPDARLTGLVERSCAMQLSAPVAAMAGHLRALHGPGVLAIVAYGSCLRGTPVSDTLIDYYLLTETPAAITTNRLSALGLKLVPPNVYHAYLEVDGQSLQAKYACLTLAVFARKMHHQTTNPYFWARFSQPCAIAYTRDAAARSMLLESLATGVTTMARICAAMARPGDDAITLWARGYGQTYRTELRSEATSRALEITRSNAAWYEAVTPVVLGQNWRSTTRAASGTPLNWPARRRKGKLLSVLRLVKAAFTFNGGADYIAAKISRHSGVTVTLKPWQRRHPVLAALVLLPGLLRKGAVR